MRFSRWEALLATLEQPIVVYDLETTHMQPELAHVVEFGAAMYGPPSLLDEGTEPPAEIERSLIPGLLFTMQQRVKPHAAVLGSGAFRRASAIHGITARDLVDVHFGPDDLQDTAAQVLSAGTVCGFNSAEYDDVVLWPGCPTHALRTSIDVLRVVRAVLSKQPGAEVEADTFERGNGADDPVFGASRLPFLPGALDLGSTEFFKETLGALSIALLGIHHTAAHGALADCLRAAEVLAACMELWPVTCPGTLAGLQALSRHPDGDADPADRLWDGWDRMLHRDAPGGQWIFTRGKHRGCALEEVDAGYLRWMTTADFSADTKSVIRGHLAVRGRR